MDRANLGARRSASPDRFLDKVAEPLEAVHQIPGTHFGRLAGAPQHPTWAAFLHDRLAAYAAAAPDLAPVAATLSREIDALDVDVPPRLLHHDLQAGHLLGGRLLDWELAVFGDPLSDLSRLAVRLRMAAPEDTLVLAPRPGPAAEVRVHLYWRIHQLADAAFSTDPVVREQPDP
ncbi:phosphotransferase [Streptomyces sp. NPDC048638]|uniref:phosphotransferase n=1 Tax=Streptomyces sp. NPDC048638 TaxID=3365580 RepID=UPI0037249F88